MQLIPCLLYTSPAGPQASGLAEIWDPGGVCCPFADVCRGRVRAVKALVLSVYLLSLIHIFKVRVNKTMPDGTVKSGVIESTLGRFLFNEIIPQDLGFVDREQEGNELLLEVCLLYTSRCV